MTKKKQQVKLCNFHQDLVDNNLLMVNLGWRVFTIQLKQNLLGDNDEKVDGLTYTDGSILLEVAVKDDEAAREILLHEIMHGITNFLGLDTEGLGQFLTITNEELVTRLSRGLLMFVNLNPDLAQRIL